MQDDNAQLRAVWLGKVIVALLLFWFFTSFARAQEYYGTNSGTNVCYWTATGTPVYVANGGGAGVDEFKVPSTNWSYFSSPNDGYWSAELINFSFNGTSTPATSSWSNGYLVVQLTAPETTTLRASGGTITFNTVQALHIASAFALSGSYTFTANASGHITSSSQYSSQKVLTWNVTNNTGTLGEWGIFQYNTSSATSETGFVQQLAWISPGGTHTFELVVSPTDTGYYAANQINLNAWVNSGSVQWIDPITGMFDITAGQPVAVNAPEDYGAGGSFMTYNGASNSGETVNADGGTTGGTSISGVTGTGVSQGSMATGKAISGGGISATTPTTGPGGTTNSTDAGVANAATAINTNITAASNAIAGQLNAGFTALNAQVAANGNQVVGAVSANGSGSVVSAINSASATAHTDAGAIATALGSGGSIATALGSSNTLATAANMAQGLTPTTGTLSSDGAGEGATEGAIVPGYSGGPSSPSETAPNFIIGFTGHLGSLPSFDASPFDAHGGASLSGVIAGARTALLWLVLAHYALYCWASVKQYMIGLSGARQAQGNAVVDGTGAQATALVAAGLISAAVVTAATAIVALLGDIGFGAVLSLFSGAGPWASMPGDVIWMLDQLFPVAAVITAYLGRIAFDAGGLKIFSVAVAVIRYITP